MERTEKKTIPIAPGLKSGRWTILDDCILSSRGERKWLCRCECGTERYVLERSLIYGGSSSCGCLRKEKASEANSYNLTGKTFGDLQVLHETSPRNTMKGRWWVCQCSCGNTYVSPGSLLVTGRRTHCGCKTDRGRPADITGKKFNRLTALYISKRNDPKDGVFWHCYCECGNEVDVSYNNLVFGNQKSCGCQKKEHDQELKTFLTHVAGTSVDMLKSKKVPTDNTTGYKGVYLVRGKYLAKIVFQKKQYFLGTYEKIEDAAEARKEAEEVLFDGVAEHYRKWKEFADNDPEWAKDNPIQVIVNSSDRKLNVTLLPDLGAYFKEVIQHGYAKTNYEK